MDAPRTRYWSGDNEQDLAQVGWYSVNSGGHPNVVGQPPKTALGAGGTHPWGLHDLHGNVWEWCQDWYEEKVYATRSVGLTVDPARTTYQVGHNAPELAESAAHGDGRVLRGGAWFDGARDTRSADRDWLRPSHSDGYVGFRLVVAPIPPEFDPRP